MSFNPNRIEAIGPPQFLGWGHPATLAMSTLSILCNLLSEATASFSLEYLANTSAWLSGASNQRSIMVLQALSERRLLRMM